jgi:hypothetical protein
MRFLLLYIIKNVERVKRYIRSFLKKGRLCGEARCKCRLYMGKIFQGVPWLPLEIDLEVEPGMRAVDRTDYVLR